MICQQIFKCHSLAGISVKSMPGNVSIYDIVQEESPWLSRVGVKWGYLASF
jgi:hypothetical protein